MKLLELKLKQDKFYNEWRDNFQGVFLCSEHFNHTIRNHFNIEPSNYDNLYLSIFDEPGKDRQRLEIRNRYIFIDEQQYYITSNTRDNLSQIWRNTNDLWFEVEYE